MLALFCLRLSWGLIVSLLILKPSDVAPRYYRVHFLTVLGLVSVAGFFLRDQADAWLWGILGTSLALCFAGSVIYHLDTTPFGKTIVVLASLTLTGALWQGGRTIRAGEAARAAVSDSEAGSAEKEASDTRRAAPVLGQGWGVADDFSAGALLGMSTSAMLMGHSYLIAPAMSLNPLMRLLAGLAASLLVRVGLAGAGLWLWTGRFASVNLESEAMLLLPVRWLLGLIGPIVLGWMAWETARIRSTQSATGILYVVVIVCFLGELTSQILVAKTGLLL